MVNQAYESLLRNVLKNGNHKTDRTSVGTISLFGPQIEFDLQESFPLLTTKKVWFKGVVHELLWMLSGSTNIKYLTDNNVHIWDDWADDEGNLGPVYGRQWRNFNGQNIDQISDVVSQIVNNPDSRRHIVCAWNPAEVSLMKLPPCHAFYQFYVNDKYLSSKLYIRSNDLFLGLPFNLASYAVLTYMIGHVCNLSPDRIIITIGDAHIYKNHIDQVNEQLSRTPYDFPKLEINRKVNNIFDFKYEDFDLINYKCHSSIKAPIAV